MLGGVRPPVLSAPHPHRRLHPPALDAFELNLPSQLVIRYHWFAFLIEVLKNLSNPRPVHYECRIENRPYLKD